MSRRGVGALPAEIVPALAAAHFTPHVARSGSVTLLISVNDLPLLKRAVVKASDRTLEVKIANANARHALRSSKRSDDARTHNRSLRAA